MSPGSRGERSSGPTRQRQFLPQVTLVVQPLLESTSDAAPVRRPENQAVCGNQILTRGVVNCLEDWNGASGIPYSFRDSLCH